VVVAVADDADPVALGERVVQQPFAAPGRRKLFVQAFAEYRARESARPVCLPGSGPEDFGLDSGDTAEIAQAGAMDVLSTLATGEAVTTSTIPPALAPGQARRRLEAAVQWSQGCAALERGDARSALARFQVASASAAEGRIYGLSTALALVALGRAGEADERLALDQTAWGSDVRYAVALAMAGTARGDLQRAEEWLSRPAEQAASRGGSSVLRRLREGALTREILGALKAAFPDDWQEHLTDAQVSKQYFYVLLWKGHAQAARAYALRMLERHKALGLETVDWVERAGDAALYGGDTQAAKASYDEALEAVNRDDRMAYWSILLKLSDVAFVSGDLARERFLREQYYGSLRER